MRNGSRNVNSREIKKRESYGPAEIRTQDLRHVKATS